MNILCVAAVSARSIIIKSRIAALLLAAATTLTISQQSLAQDQFVSIGYSNNNYSFSDSARDIANTQSSSTTTSSEGEDGMYYYDIILSDARHGYGVEFGAQTYAFDYEYVNTDSGNSFTKELTGSVHSFNLLYSFKIIESTRLFAKAGVNFSSSFLAVNTSSSLSGYGSDDLFGIGFGAGLLFLPSLSNWGFLIKYDNFGTVVKNYENNKIVWASDGERISSGNLDLSSVTIALVYKVPQIL